MPKLHRKRKSEGRQYISFAKVLFIVFGLYVGLQSVTLHTGDKVLSDDFKKDVFVSLSARQKHASTLQEVEREVAKRNVVAQDERQRFINAGWKLVSETPPNPKVMALDSDALPQLETEFQVHLQTNTFSGEMLDRVKEVALRTNDEKTRFVAIDSLGRAADPQGQQLLMSLFEALPSQSDRQQILQMMKPASTDDAVSSFLYRQIAAIDASSQEKRQAAFAIATHYLVTSMGRGGDEPPDELLRRIASDYQEEFRSIYKRLRYPNKKK